MHVKVHKVPRRAVRPRRAVHAKAGFCMCQGGPAHLIGRECRHQVDYPVSTGQSPSLLQPCIMQPPNPLDGAACNPCSGILSWLEGQFG